MTATDPLLWITIAVLFVLGLALIASQWPKWIKALLVVGVTALYFVSDGLLDNVWGWPSRHAMPERFVLLSMVVDEPTKSQSGALYLWVNALEDGKPAAKPRAYVLPYAKDLHALLTESMKKIHNGITQVGTSEPKSGQKGFSWLRPGNDEQSIKIKDLPVTQLPEK